MPEYKKQHYIPKFYLRNFSNQNELINTYIPNKGKFIRNIPLKDQCQENYFYGAEIKLEKKISLLEDNNSKMLNEIIENSYSVFHDSEKKIAAYLSFVVFQYLRTKAKKQEADGMLDALVKSAMKLNNQIKGENLDTNAFKVTNKNSTLLALQQLETCVLVAHDLKFKLLINVTDENYITSDSPVVMINPLFTKFGLNDISFSWSAKGLILVLPITPKILFLFYDKNIYKFINEKELVYEIRKCSDIQKINKLQILNYLSNIYYAEVADEKSIEFLKNTSQNKKKRNTRVKNMTPNSITKGKEELILQFNAPCVYDEFNVSFMEIKQSRLKDYFTLDIDVDNQDLRRDPELVDYLKTRQSKEN